VPTVCANRWHRIDSIYVFNLRGNARTSGELRQKEAGNVFGGGSRTPIAITLLVKKGTTTSRSTEHRSTEHGARSTEHGARSTEQQKSAPNSQFSTINSAFIYYHDIGDYLNREEKLARIHTFGSMINVPLAELTPNEHGDWISLRNEGFEKFIALGDKENVSGQDVFFHPLISNGVKTNRDAFSYNCSTAKLTETVKKSIDFFNLEVNRYDLHLGLTIDNIQDFIRVDSRYLVWDYAQKVDILKQKYYAFSAESIRKSYYRPYFKQNIYFNRDLINRVYQIPKLFPTATSTNLVICVSGVGVTKDFSCIITDTIPDLELIGKSQCFPLYYYEPAPTAEADMFAAPRTGDGLVRRDGISDWMLAQAQQRYGAAVSKEDIFYYVYGFLHSPDYRTTYANDLKKMLPRLPLVERTADFWAFSRAGRALAALHVDYEQVPAHPQVVVR
jgi:predicted helicase